MDREKWAKYDRISTLLYSSKLAEETGEVATEINDYNILDGERITEPSLEYAKRKKNCKKRRKHLQDALIELDHVIFIASQMRGRVNMELETVNDEWDGMD